MRCLRMILLLLWMPLVLGGCSMVKTVYNSSPDLAYWWIDRFVDISAEQRPVLIDDLQAYQQWHRTTQLPRYTQWLQQLQSMALQDVSEEQACKVFREIWESLPTLAENADGGTARLVSSLSVEQLEHLRNKLERQHRDWRRDWVEPEAADLLKSGFSVRANARRTFTDAWTPPSNACFGNKPNARLMTLRWAKPCACADKKTS